jgi:AcrR family transcriptional regulator
MIPRIAPRRSQSERIELSDRRMRNAAIQLLVEEGVSGTTLAAIGSRAGYSRGLVTHRFGSKAGLLRYVLQCISLRWRTTLAAHTAGKSGVAALCGAVDAQLALIRDAPDEVRAMFLLWFVSIDPGTEFRANVRHVHETQRRDVAAWIEEGKRAGTVAPGVDPDRIAGQFCASMLGIVYHWLVDPQLPLKEMHEELKLQVLTGYGSTAFNPQGQHDARRIHS